MFAVKTFTMLIQTLTTNADKFAPCLKYQVLLTVIGFWVCDVPNLACPGSIWITHQNFWKCTDFSYFSRVCKTTEIIEIWVISGVVSSNLTLGYFHSVSTTLNQSINQSKVVYLKYSINYLLMSQCMLSFMLFVFESPDKRVIYS